MCPISVVAAPTDHMLEVTRRGVVVRGDDADVARDAADVEVLGGLLFIKEAVLATSHGLPYWPKAESASEFAAGTPSVST